jgi:predicted nucleic-acid-binding protein
MIAIDTNVLLRHILQDDGLQSAKATELLMSHERVLVTDIVLVESIWTLSGKKYRASRDDIIKLINDLLGEPNIVFENPQAIWVALNDFRADYKQTDEDGRKMKLPDFPDVLIINKARQTAKKWGESLEAVYSFDTGALRVAGVKRP